MFKNIYQPNEDQENEDDIKEKEKEDDLMEEDDQDEMSNELIRQYQEEDEQNERNAERELSTDNTTETTHKNKRRLAIQPTGSDEEADTESDAGETTRNFSRKILHSTLREEEQPNTNLRTTKANTVPETPNNMQTIQRYKSESAAQNPTSSHTEAFRKQTEKQMIKTLNGNQYA